MKPQILLLSVMLLFISCRDKYYTAPIDGMAFSKTYVQVYTDVEEIKCQQTLSKNYILVMFDGKDIKYSPSGRFKELSEKYGDTYFNRNFVPYSNYAIADEFSIIDVTSDKDYNAELLAGMSLSSIVTLVAASPYKYIKSGYTESYDWRNAPEDYKDGDITGFAAYLPVNKPLDAITREDLLLLDWKAYLRFREAPTLEKEHTITVTFKNDEKEVSTTVDMVFE